LGFRCGAQSHVHFHGSAAAENRQGHPIAGALLIQRSPQCILTIDGLSVDRDDEVAADAEAIHPDEHHAIRPPQTRGARRRIVVDIGAGGHGIKTDCHDATHEQFIDYSSAGPTTWGGCHDQGLSTGVSYRF